MNSHYLSFMEENIHYYEAGDKDAPVIFMMHGNSSSALAFDFLLQEPLPGYRYIALDYPGHGKSEGSEKLESFYTFEGCSLVAKYVLSALNVEPSVIIGHSMGGHVANYLLADYPSVEKVIFISSPPIAGSDAIPNFFKDDAPMNLIFTDILSESEKLQLAFSFSNKNVDESSLSKIKNDINSTHGRFREVLGNSLQGDNIINELEALNHSTVKEVYFIGGKHDAFIKPTYYQFVDQNVINKSISTLLLDNAGHCPHRESTKEVKPFINSALDATWESI